MRLIPILLAAGLLVAASPEAYSQGKGKDRSPDVVSEEAADAKQRARAAASSELGAEQAERTREAAPGQLKKLEKQESKLQKRTDHEERKRKAQMDKEEAMRVREVEREREGPVNDDEDRSPKADEMLQRRDERKQIQEEYRADRVAGQEGDNASDDADDGEANKKAKKSWWKFWD